MLLLDSPPEIFRQVISIYVATSGLCAAWKRREVCRTFKSYITEETLGRQPMKTYNHRPNQQLLLRGIQTYLGLRSKALYGAHNLLPTIIRRSVAHFVEFEGKTSAAERDDYINRASTAVSINCLKLKLIAIHPKSQSLKAAAKDPVESLALCIAVGIGDLELLKVVLKHHTCVWKQTYCFGYPLEVAIRTDDLNIVKLLLAKHDSTSDDISSALVPIITNMLLFPRVQEEILKTLATWYLDTLGRPTDSICTRWMTGAKNMSSADVTSKILDMGTSANLLLLYRLNYLEQRGIHSAILLNFLLKKKLLSTERHYTPGTKFNDGPPDQSLLESAIRRGDVSSVRILLEAGANPNGVTVRGQLEHPLNRAIDAKDTAIVELLVNSGAGA